MSGEVERPEEVPPGVEFQEGSTIQVIVNRYERDLAARECRKILSNGHGLLIRQSCNQQDDRWILVSNASIDTFIETLAELAKDSSGESNAA